MSAIEKLAVDELFELSIEFDQFQIFPSALGTRLVAVVGGGQVSGPRLHGEVAPGGGDWLLLGPDHLARMDVRASIRTADGTMVYVTGTGRTELFGNARERFLAGATVTDVDGEVHSRLALVFETNDEHRWLNAAVAVGVVSELSLRHIRYGVYGIA